MSPWKKLLLAIPGLVLLFIAPKIAYAYLILLFSGIALWEFGRKTPEKN